jgi:stage II sporulation protein GA (sporulation sigma-E factor processing peptidase)
MRGVVYVDMLFFVNAIIGWLLLAGGARLAGIRQSGGRLLLGGALAGGASFILLLQPLPSMLLWGIKLGSAVAVAAAAYPWQGWRVFAKGVFWYIFLNVALSGVVFAAMYYGGAANIETNNLALYFHISPLLLVGCVMAVYLVLELCRFVLGKPQETAMAAFSACCAGAEIQGVALLDTGFCVRDPISGAPAFLLSLPQVRAQLTPVLAGALDGYFTQGELAACEGAPPLRLLPVGTATGVRALPALRATALRLHTPKPIHARNMLAVFTPERLGEGAFCAVVNLQDCQEYGRGAVNV